MSQHTQPRVSPPGMPDKAAAKTAVAAYLTQVYLHMHACQPTAYDRFKRLTQGLFTSPTPRR